MEWSGCAPAPTVIEAGKGAPNIKANKPFALRQFTVAK
jgi:hypothetical protein